MWRMKRRGVSSLIAFCDQAIGSDGSLGGSAIIYDRNIGKAAATEFPGPTEFAILRRSEAWLSTATTLLASAALMAPAAAQDAVEAAPEPLALHKTALSAEQSGDMASALDGFARACDAGLAPSCTMAGLIKLEGAERIEPLMDAARDLAAGCLAGSDFACAGMGMALGNASARATGKEGFVAIALLQMGEDCRAAPDGSACNDGAALLRAEERGGADMDAVYRYAAKACARDVRPGCLPTAANPEDRVLTADQAASHCLAWRADGCNSLLETLLKSGDSQSGAMTTLESACAHRFGIACANLGLYFSQGPVAARDDDGARRFMRAGCDGAVAQACFAFAVMHKKGVGGPVDTKRSVALVVHACDLGWPKACETLATIVEDGEAPAGPDHHPATLRQRACQLGSDGACGARAPTSTPPA